MRLPHLAVPALLAAAIPAAQAATVTTGWEANAGNQDQCIATAADAIGRTGFRVTIAQDRQAVFGWRGEENISIRCIGDRGLAVIFIYTHAGRDNNQLMAILRDEYRRGGGKR
ncbi:hypothetical protein [Rubritepida flocculans]|uniref:hypothetical protein n=1 Tax=Rubritepida flocculans TaxID=182403 RepID=UPI0004010987|nr:hypothetical protein [Rubritepida flocculans]